MSERVAVVTGASSGIGRATAGLLARHGFRVFGTSRRPSEGAPPGVTLLSLDVRDEGSVQALVRSVLEQAGRIDLLVNNAGYTQTGAIEENSLEDVRAQFETNVFGVLRVAKAVLPVMRRQGGGRIINVSSVLGRIAPAFAGIYAGSKFALEGLTEALRGELRPLGIHVSLIEPSFVKSNLLDQAPSAPLADYEARRRAGEAFLRQGVEGGIAPEVVAQTILKAATAARPRLRYPVGGTSRALIALKRVLPESLFERFRGRAFPAEAARS